MEGLTKRSNEITTLTKHRNAALKFFGVTTIAFGMYVLYLASTNDSVMDAKFTVTDI